MKVNGHFLFDFSATEGKSNLCTEILQSSHKLITLFLLIWIKHFIKNREKCRKLNRKVHETYCTRSVPTANRTRSWLHMMVYHDATLTPAYSSISDQYWLLFVSIIQSGIISITLMNEAYFGNEINLRGMLNYCSSTVKVKNFLTGTSENVMALNEAE